MLYNAAHGEQMFPPDINMAIEKYCYLYYSDARQEQLSSLNTGLCMCTWLLYYVCIALVFQVLISLLFKVWADGGSNDLTVSDSQRAEKHQSSLALLLLSNGWSDFKKFLVSILSPCKCNNSSEAVSPPNKTAIVVINLPTSINDPKTTRFTKQPNNLSLEW